MDVKTNGYFTLMKDQGYLFAGAPPFPFHTSSARSDPALLLQVHHRRAHA